MTVCSRYGWILTASLLAFSANAWAQSPDTAANPTAPVAVDQEKTPLVSRQYIINSGYVLDESQALGTIIGAFNRRMMLGEGETVFVNLGKNDGAEPGKRYLIVRNARKVFQPSLESQFYRTGNLKLYDRAGDAFFLGHEFAKNTPSPRSLLDRNKKPLGRLIIPKGILEITEVGENKSTALIVNAFDPIQLEDGVTPFQEPELVYEEDYKPAEGKMIEADIIDFRGDSSIAGMAEVAYIDKGSADGVVPGDWFQITETTDEKVKAYSKLTFQTNTIKMLPVHVGLLRIISTQEKTATAIIVRNARELSIGHKVKFVRMDTPPAESVQGESAASKH